MKKDKEKTKVIFRVFKGYAEGEVIAIFPEELGNNNHWNCASYMHQGQHSSCSPDFLIGVTRIAKPEEYADLKAELESIGYNLEIRKRNSYYYSISRFNQLMAKKKAG